jgi:hypothetical protein
MKTFQILRSPGCATVLGLILFFSTPCIAQKTSSPAQKKLIKVFRQVDNKIQKKVRRRAVRKYKKQNKARRASDNAAVVTFEKFKVACSSTGSALVSGELTGSYDKPVFSYSKDIQIEFKNCNGLSGQGTVTGDATRQPGNHEANNDFFYVQDIMCTGLTGNKVAGDLSAHIIFDTSIDLNTQKITTFGTGDLDVTCDFTDPPLTVLSCEWKNVNVTDKEAIEDGCSLFPFL